MAVESVTEDWIVQEVKALIAEYTGVEVTMLSLETSLVEDLGVDGDDATDLLEALSREFQVDLSDLNVSDYFNAEGFDLRMLFRSGKTRLKSLTVKHLVNAVKAGKWSSECTNC
ncbi:DUF1493 family protein [Leptolyngbya sp. AN03gr2]|uniref:DUF1493 family protein n=1 Tax=unclassified Leptolyngbya TaxID=2650499 RepID=UPI003D320848